ncbi:MAG: hypothetical protein ACD_83C00290G0002 [uncultured bacterium]|nr:MAG: hypothetical protein ACD_83C00290G0002 [uncultured bacterium]
MATKTLPQSLSRQTEIIYDSQGKPVSVVLPYLLFSKYIDETQTKPTKSKKVYNITDKQIIAAVRETRQEIFNKYYADKLKDFTR